MFNQAKQAFFLSLVGVFLAHGADDEPRPDQPQQASDQALFKSGDRFGLIRQMSLSCDDRYLAVIFNGRKSCVIWDTTTQNVVAGYQTTYDINCCAWNPRFNQLAIGLVGGFIELLQLDSETNHRSVEHTAYLNPKMINSTNQIDTQSVQLISWSSDGKKLIALYKDPVVTNKGFGFEARSTLRMWDCEQKSCIGALSLPKHVFSLQWGKKVLGICQCLVGSPALVSMSSLLKRTSEVEQTLLSLLEESGQKILAELILEDRVHACHWSPDGTLLAIHYLGGRVDVMDLSGNRRAVPQRPEYPELSADVCWTYDHKIVVGCINSVDLIDPANLSFKKIMIPQSIIENKGNSVVQSLVSAHTMPFSLGGTSLIQADIIKFVAN